MKSSTGVALVSTLPKSESIDEGLKTFGAETYWKNRWQSGATGWKFYENGKEEDFAFHIFRNNFEALRDAVIAHGLQGAPSSGCEATLCADHHHVVHVFVPLCGDSSIIDYLIKYWIPNLSKNNHNIRVHVVGVDLAESALEKTCARFPKDCVTEEETANGNLYTRRWMIQSPDQPGNTATLYCGDFFQLTRHFAEGDSTQQRMCFDLIYDRASMIAIEPKLRSDYAASILSLLRPSGERNINQSLEEYIPYPTILLELVQRAEGDRENGPPFHIEIDDVSMSYFNKENGFSSPFYLPPSDRQSNFFRGKLPFYMYGLVRSGHEEEKKKM